MAGEGHGDSIDKEMGRDRRTRVDVVTWPLVYVLGVDPKMIHKKGMKGAVDSAISSRGSEEHDSA